LLISASFAVWAGCTSTLSHFVFAAVPSANEVAVYREDPNSGVLTALAGSPYTLGTTASPQSLVVHPSKKFLYVANSQESDISLFDIATDGALTEVTPRTTAGTTPILLAIDPSGGFLYVANAGSNNISIFSIDSGSGTLTQVTGSPYPIGFSPISMRLAPSGNFLYVGGGGSPGVVEVFAVSSGNLSVVVAYQTGTNPYGIEIDPTGAYLYTANFGDSSISEFTIDSSNGTLSEISGSPIGETTTTSAPVALLVDPSGSFLFVANNGTGNIAAYSIGTASGSAGALTILTNSGYVTGAHPNFMVFDPNGKYLMVANQTGQIQAFGWDPVGQTLTLIASYSTGNTPTSIAVVQ